MRNVLLFNCGQVTGGGLVLCRICGESSVMCSAVLHKGAPQWQLRSLLYTCDSLNILQWISWFGSGRVSGAQARQILVQIPSVLTQVSNKAFRWSFCARLAMLVATACI